MTEFTGENRWKRGERKEIVLRSWRATEQTEVPVLGQNDKVLEHDPEADPTSRFKRIETGLELSVMRAQRICNNRLWPNTVAVMLENVEYPGNWSI